MAKTNTIITIGRQFGSAGREIGYQVAKDLDIKLYDKEMLDRAAKESGYYNYYSNKKWGAAESYDICLDSSKLGREGTAEAIERLIEIKERGGDKKL